MFFSAVQNFLFQFIDSPPSKIAEHLLPFSNPPQNLEDVKKLLINEKKNLTEWIPYQHVLATTIENHAGNLELDRFLSDIVQHAIKENAIEHLAFISSLLSFAKMEQMLKQCKGDYPGIEVLAKEEALLYPKPEEKKRPSLFYKEGSRLLSSFFSIITNLIDSLLEILSLSTSSKFRNLFDRNQIWDIFFKLLAFIPYILIPLLRPFFSDKVYLVAILLITGVGILTVFYKRWIKPLPKIINSEPLEEKIEKGKIHTVENPVALQQLIQSLIINESVLLVAKSGEGKTALVHHFVEWKNQKPYLNAAGQLRPSQELKQLTGTQINCGPMIGDITFGHIEQMEKLANQVGGWHKKLFLFLDEFFQIVSNPNAFRMFKDCFLKCSNPVRFIAAVTYEEFKKLSELDLGSSFRRCVNIIFIEESSSNHLQLILREFRKRKPSYIRISDQAMDKVIELSKSEGYLKGVGRPAKAERLLNKAVGICMAAYQGCYSSKQTEEIGKLSEKIQLESDSYRYADSSDSKARQALIESKQKVQKLKDQFNEQCKKIEKIKNLFDVKENLTKRYIELTHTFAEQPSLQNMDAKTKVLYLLYHFYARKEIMTCIEGKLNEMKEIPLQVNEALVQQAFEILKKGEQQTRE